MSERRGYRVEDRRRVIPLEYRVNRDTSINPNTWRHKRENTPSMINERPETKAWNFFKNILPTGGNVGRHVGNYLSDWNAGLQSGDNSGIMAAMTDTSNEYQSAANLSEYLAQPSMPGDLGSINFQIDMYNDLYNDAIKGGNQGDSVHYLDSIQHLMGKLPRAARGGLMSLNGGGSVQSGPRARKKLQPRITEDIQNRLPPYNAKPDYDFGPPRAEPWPYDPNREWPDPMPLGQGNMGAFPTGITNSNKGSNILSDYLNYANTDFDFKDYSNQGEGRWVQDEGRWLDNNPWFINLMTNRHGGPDSKKYLKDIFKGGGIPLGPGNISPILGDDEYGAMYTIPLGGKSR